jgi:hypothetical protein
MIRQDIPIGAIVMVDYKYASPHPYEAIVKQYSSNHNTYRCSKVDAPHYDPWLRRDQLQPLWMIESD